MSKGMYVNNAFLFLHIGVLKMRMVVNKHWQVYLVFDHADSLSLQL